MFLNSQNLPTVVSNNNIISLDNNIISLDVPKSKFEKIIGEKGRKLRNLKQEFNLEEILLREPIGSTASTNNANGIKGGPFGTCEISGGSYEDRVACQKKIMEILDEESEQEEEVENSVEDIMGILGMWACHVYRRRAM